MFRIIADFKQGVIILSGKLDTYILFPMIKTIFYDILYNSS